MFGNSVDELHLHLPVVSPCMTELRLSRREKRRFKKTDRAYSQFQELNDENTLPIKIKKRSESRLSLNLAMLVLDEIFLN